MSSLVSSLWVLVYGVAGVSACLATYYWQATLYKVKLYCRAVLYLLLSTDTKWKPTDIQDPALFPQGVQKITKRVIFVRHAESNWNETFNRGFNPIFFIPRVLYACAFEFFLLLKGTRDSWFYDSSLSHLGLSQVSGLRSALLQKSNNETLEILSGRSNRPSVIVSSPLRRALSTAVYALQDRLKSAEEKIIILPSLQEISRNMDTLPLTPAYTAPVPSWIEVVETRLDVTKMYTDRVDYSQWSGCKPLRSTGLLRLLEFNKWLFARKGDETVIVAGHSLWFMAYFRTFLPRDSKSVAKAKKVKNCAAISFTVECAVGPDGREVYRIDESTIAEDHLGFSA